MSTRAVAQSDSLAEANVGALPVGHDRGFSRVNRQPKSKIFTKFGDVKSRLSWTAERRQLLQEMWKRGDKAAAIAAALGCKVGAISIARRRFGLKPRSIVPGRPPHESDEPAHKIERVALTTSRLMEFCTEKELVAQTGHESYQWSRVIIKELVDNGIDACEEAGVAPVIKVTLTTGKSGNPTRIVVEDNGPGIPSETVAGIIDYNIRVSSREAYVSPTRGRQGNALKTILPMAYVLGGKVKGETWIEARRIKHRILFSVNHIKQEPIVRNIRSRSQITVGTRVTVFWPSKAVSRLEFVDGRYWHRSAEIDPDAIGELLQQFIWVNPHLTLRFTVDGKTVKRHRATDPSWTKYRACDATSAHWYTPEQFERYAGALIDCDEQLRKKSLRTSREKVTVREFIAQFRGMSSTQKQKLILRELGVPHLSLHPFFGSETQVNHQRMKELLRLLRKHTRSVSPESLGVVGKDHLRRLSTAADGEEQSFKYSLSTEHDDAGRPYVVEIATCAFKEWVRGKERARGRLLITGINFSATLENPFESLRNMQTMEALLTDLRAGEDAPVIVCVHYACPHIEYLDRGKSRIGLE
jgi:hypothetical protein